MESNVLVYFDEIPDKYLALMAEYNWGKLEVYITLLTFPNYTQPLKLNTYQEFHQNTLKHYCPLYFKAG